MIEQKVLDHGYIKLTHKMVDENDDKQFAQTLDQMVVAAARVSYGGDLKGDDKDKKLLHYLIEHEHGSPLESAVFRFEIKLPIFVMRQWIRHRWASYNEISGRYTEEVSNEYYVPEVFRAQDTKNKQGSTEEDLGCEHVPYSEFGWTNRDAYENALGIQKDIYQELIKGGIAKELARGVLGTAFYTKFVWTVNARSLMNFLILRCDSHAQWEIRQYANVILDMLKQEMPWTHEALIKYFKIKG